MALSDLPTLNALLNILATALLLSGYIMVRLGNVEIHRTCMLAAFATSTVFLVSYLIYHFNVGSVPFTGQGPIRILYFTVLISHIILAALVPPLALVTLTHGLKKRFDRHRRIARWTLPIWLYVSVTGVIVYVMLY